jgi:hypothetical protein
MSVKKTIKKRRRRKKWTKKQLDVLYECWKGADTNKERLSLVEEKLPNIPPLAALYKMRIMAKTDSKWIGMATRRKKQKEREKFTVELEKQKKKDERERKKIEHEKRRKEREEKRKKREEIKSEKKLKEKIKSLLLLNDGEKIKDKIDLQLFFCSKIHQYIDEISCIFRIFSKEYGLSGGPCEKCTKMDKYIPVLQEVIENGRQNRIRQNKTSERSSKAQKKTKDKKGRSSKKVATIEGNARCRKSSKFRRNATTK